MAISLTARSNNSRIKAASGPDPAPNPPATPFSLQDYDYVDPTVDGNSGNATLASGGATAATATATSAKATPSVSTQSPPTAEFYRYYYRNTSRYKLKVTDGSSVAFADETTRRPASPARHH